MTHKYEYKFVRLAEGIQSAKTTAKGGYKPIVKKHADEGWRLVQLFAPPTGALGTGHYVEAIFEREVQK